MPSLSWAARANSSCHPRKRRPSIPLGAVPEARRPGRRTPALTTVRRRGRKLRHDGTMRFAYLGPEGTFTEAAAAVLAAARARADAELVPCASVGAALTAVRTGAAERAVVPI